MANYKIYDKVDVSLPEHQYSITICHDGLLFPRLLQDIVSTSQVLIVTNQTVAPFYLKQVQLAFAGVQCDVVILPDGENHKNQHSLFAIYNELIEKRHHRDTTIIALGGGVVGDVAGFAASSYQRGVRLVHIPTTLLAQVDSSVGGKTAINHPQGKNLIGSFYQPQAVLIDVATLATLPDREFRAGLAEMIKYALLAGGAFWHDLYEELAQGLTAKSLKLPQLIARCCQIKAGFVEADEKENGQRALLNLGHTFAHALETYTQYKQWLHGEAVAIGLYCAALLSHKLNRLDLVVLTQIKQMLNDASLPFTIPHTVNIDKLCDLMRLDKKVRNNLLRLVLIKRPGECYLDDQINEDFLYQTLAAARGE